MSDSHAAHGNEGHASSEHAAQSEAKEIPPSKWSHAQQEEFSHLYEKAMARPDYQRIKGELDAAVFPKSGELPFKEAKDILKQYIPEDLESKMDGKKESHKPASSGGLAALAGSIAVVGGIALANYALMGLGLLATGYSFVRNSYSKQPAH